MSLQWRENPQNLCDFVCSWLELKRVPHKNTNDADFCHYDVYICLSVSPNSKKKRFQKIKINQIKNHQKNVSIFHHGSLCCFGFLCLVTCPEWIFYHQGTWRQVLAPCIRPGCAAEPMKPWCIKPFELASFSLLNICTVIPKSLNFSHWPSKF